MKLNNWCPTQRQVANIMTKPLDVFLKVHELMGVCSLSGIN